MFIRLIRITLHASTSDIIVFFIIGITNNRPRNGRPRVINAKNDRHIHRTSPTKNMPRTNRAGPCIARDFLQRWSAEGTLHGTCQNYPDAGNFPERFCVENNVLLSTVHLFE